jgi:hypothetical protein
MPSNPDSPTPITDKAAILCCHVVACPMEVARKLELELSRARAECADLRNMLHRTAKEAFGLDDTISNESYDVYFIRQVAKLKAANATLTAALAAKEAEMAHLQYELTNAGEAWACLSDSFHKERALHYAAVDESKKLRTQLAQARGDGALLYEALNWAEPMLHGHHVRDDTEVREKVRAALRSAARSHPGAGEEKKL